MSVFTILYSMDKIIIFCAFNYNISQAGLIFFYHKFARILVLIVKIVNGQ